MPLFRPGRHETVPPLAGCRVLVAEDEYLVARDVADIMARAGAEVVGPVPTVVQALALARSEALGAAVLDVDLRGERIYPVIALLRERRVPVVLATGYRDEALPVAYRDLPYVEKPFDPGSLLRVVARACTADASSGAVRASLTMVRDGPLT